MKDEMRPLMPLAKSVGLTCEFVFGYRGGFLTRSYDTVVEEDGSRVCLATHAVEVRDTLLEIETCRVDDRVTRNVQD